MFAVRTFTVIVPPGPVLPPQARLDTERFGNPRHAAPDTVSAYSPVPSKALSSTSTAYAPSTANVHVATARAENPQPASVAPVGVTTRQNGLKLVPPRFVNATFTVPATPPKLHRSVSARATPPSAAGLSATPHFACPPQRQSAVSRW